MGDLEALLSEHLREVDRLRRDFAVTIEEASSLRTQLQAKSEQLIRYVRQYGPEPSVESRCPHCRGTGRLEK